jgi:hypothetical protein
MLVCSSLWGFCLVGKGNVLDAVGYLISFTLTFQGVSGQKYEYIEQVHIFFFCATSVLLLVTKLLLNLVCQCTFM